MKKQVRTILRRFGIDVHRSKMFGSNALKDVSKIIGRDNVRSVFDIGANEGQTALQLVSEFPLARVLAFEPFPAVFETLKANLAGHPRVTPLNLAASNKTGIQTLFLTQYSLTNSLLPTATEASKVLGDCVQNAGQIEIQAITLDDFCHRENIDNIDLLKMDAQGFEGKILEGADALLRSGKIKTVLTEVNFVPLYKDQAFFHDIYEILWRHNFRLVSFYDQIYRSGTHMSWCDALFVKEML